ncbi:MAG: flagellar basal body-associated FliL family protein [Oscillospiraceae bacterium]|nr:flagellar basal body-associated FliL family protein [Oscillospiraceae bacterium]
MKKVFNRLIPIVAVLLLALFVLAACDSPDPRIASVVTYSPGGQFSTNFSWEQNQRAQVRCLITFTVVDERAIEELTDHNFVIRNSVLSVLGELTIEEITTERDLNSLAERIVARVNEDLGASVELITGAYFTEFGLA